MIMMRIIISGRRAVRRSAPRVTTWILRYRRERYIERDVYVYIYIYIYREREREREREIFEPQALLSLFALVVMEMHCA